MKLIPSYVFGGTDFFYNLANEDNVLSRLSRRFRIVFALYYGPVLLPVIPFTPRVTLILGIYIYIWCMFVLCSAVVWYGIIGDTMVNRVKMAAACGTIHIELCDMCF